MSNVRVRFAPSPTGPLHIGGLRTALFNYLYAKKNGGSFVLRIEDTDRNRYVKGSEAHILDSLKWCGITPDEGPFSKGKYGPYRQSERQNLYSLKIKELIEKNHAYYAFDTNEELSELRKECEKKGAVFSYGEHNRKTLKNSIVYGEEKTNALLSEGKKHVVRFKMPKNKEVLCKDLLRGEIKINTKTLDDKILYKSDGMPTYHFANVVDDREMKISHVIRGEEWLPSLALHVLIYEAFGWGDKPDFIHLPLILKPQGKGKLSKRDGEKLGFPVFAIKWTGDKVIKGYRENGFTPEAVVNFLSLLGWNPGNEKEVFTLKELVSSFSIKGLNNSGARFDPEKNTWFNHAHIQQITDEEIGDKIIKEFNGDMFEKSDVNKIAALIKPRLNALTDIKNTSGFFFNRPEHFDKKDLKKFKNLDFDNIIRSIIDVIDKDHDLNLFKENLEEIVKNNQWGFGKVLGLIRLSVVGNLSGPDLFKTVDLLGKKECLLRLDHLRKTLSEA